MRLKPRPVPRRVPLAGPWRVAGCARSGGRGPALRASRPGLSGLLLLALALLLAQGLGRFHGLAHGLALGQHAGLQAQAGFAGLPGAALPQRPAAAAGPHTADARGDGHAHPHAHPHAADHAAGSALCQLLDDLAQAPIDLPVLPGLSDGPAAEARPATLRPARPQAEAPAPRARDPPARA